MLPMHPLKQEPRQMNPYPNVHPGSAAMGVTTVSTILGTIGTYAQVLTPVLQDLAYLIAIVSGCISIYFFVKKHRKGA
jgi:hypothetical protein